MMIGRDLSEQFTKLEAWLRKTGCSEEEIKKALDFARTLLEAQNDNVSAR